MIACPAYTCKRWSLHWVVLKIMLWPVSVLVTFYYSVVNNVNVPLGCQLLSEFDKGICQGIPPGSAPAVLWKRWPCADHSAQPEVSNFPFELAQTAILCSLVFCFRRFHNKPLVTAALSCFNWFRSNLSVLGTERVLYLLHKNII